MQTTKLLLVEDDENLGYVLVEYLGMHDFDVCWAKNGEEALQKLQQNPPQLCILDVMMPRLDGFSLAQQIKLHYPQLPFIFLTARSLKVDKLKGFKLGADDYLSKPIDEEELIARIRVVLRRVYPETAPAPESHIYPIGAYTFDYENLLLKKQEQHIQLTQKEAELLLMLTERKGKILDRREVLQRLWGEADFFNRRSMDVFISRLRKYLSEDANIRIINVHGKGFILNDTPQPPTYT